MSRLLSGVRCAFECTCVCEYVTVRQCVCVSLRVCIGVYVQVCCHSIAKAVLPNLEIDVINQYGLSILRIHKCCVTPHFYACVRAPTNVFALISTGVQVVNHLWLHDSIMTWSWESETGYLAECGKEVSATSHTYSTI